MQKPTTKKTVFFHFFCISVVLFCLACSDASPSIDQSLAKRLISLNTKTGIVSQQLAVFSVFRFADGAKNLQSMYILNDNLQILWNVSGKDLQFIEHFDRKYVGNANLAFVSGEPIPNGKFRVVLYDRAGHKAQSEFAVPRTDNDPLSMIPRGQRKQMRMFISPTLQVGRVNREIVIKDWSGTETNRYSVLRDNIDISSIAQGRRENEYSLWLIDTWPNEGLILQSGPW